jgi:hypothetical protein
MTYESGKQLLVKYSGTDSPVSPMAVALAGGFCGMVSLAAVRLSHPSEGSHVPIFLPSSDLTTSRSLTL